MRRLIVVVSAFLVVSLAGCQGGEPAPADTSPQARLAAAKRGLDAAEFVGFTLATDHLPDGLDGLLSATGTGTHDPAFTGDVKVQAGVTDITAPLVAVDGAVYAKLPFVGWNTIDPADYGAPDPSRLMDSRAGISSLFTATENPTAGDAQRNGDQVLSTVNGTLPGSAVNRVFPSSGAGDFTVALTLTSSDDVQSVTMTGPFYDGSDDVTYTIDFDLEAAAVDIQAPA